MLCSKNTTDPIADKLYKQENFMLLRRGFNPQEFKPGMLLVKPTRSDCVPMDSEGLFHKWPKLTIRTDPFRSLSADTWSDVIDVGASVELAGVIAPGAAESELAEIEAALKAANVASFQVKLGGADLSTIKLQEFEAGAGKLKPTELGQRYFEQGRQFFLILETLSVSSALLRLEDQSKLDGFLKSKVAQLGSGGIKAAAARSAQATAKLSPGTADVVIAFKAVELLFNEGIYLDIAKPPGPLRTQGDSRVRMATLEELSNEGNSLFLRVGAGAT